MVYSPKKPITIRDVARKANVSTKTVSRVINAESGVNAETRAHVTKIVEELDYRPNINAQSLAGDRSFLIGLFFENPGSYVTDFQTGVIARCREAGMHLMIEPWHSNDPDLASKVSTPLRQLRLDGVILLPPHCDNPVILEALRKERVPIVRIAPKINSIDSPIVRTHDYVAARLLTAHLLNLGHRRIGFIEGCQDHSASEQRFKAFTDEMAHQSIAIDHDLVLPGEFDFHCAKVSAKKLLSLPSPPTAIFACNDDMAVGVLVVAQGMGIRVPEDLSVVGFDDTPTSLMTHPQITTVRQPVQDIGRAAADLIIAHAPRRNGWPEPMPHLMLPFEIIVRGSTGPAPAKKPL